MQEDQNNSSQTNFKFSSFTEIKEIILYFVSNWKWIFLGVSISLISAYLFLRYSIPEYRSFASIMIKDNQRSGAIDPTRAVFSDLTSVSNLNINLDNEMEIIHSRSIIRNTINTLGLNVYYIIQGNLKNKEIYETRPVKLHVKQLQDSIVNSNFVVKIKGIDDMYFNLISGQDEFIGKFAYGQIIKIPQAELFFTKTFFYDQYKQKPYEILVSYTPIEQVVDNYYNRLKVTKPNKNTNTLELSFVGTLRNKSEDFLNTLIKVYNNDVIIDKNAVFESTSKFIQERINSIADELDDVEKSTENFKRQNHLTNLENEAYIVTNGANSFQIKELEVDTQLKIIETMQDYVRNIKDYNVLPENIISLSTSTSGLITSYNEMALDRKRLLQDAGPKHIKVTQLEEKLDDLHISIQQSLVQLAKNYQHQLVSMRSQNSIYNAKIDQVPVLERNAKKLGRQQNIKEQLYLYLLQKREETAISLAVTSPNAKVVDSAASDKAPTTPNRSMLYIAALALGFIIPAAILYGLKMIDNKVKGRRDIEKIVNIPIVGEIPSNQSGVNYEIVSNSSIIAEAIRILRSNLNFILPIKKEGQGQTIFITSSIPKEGKTFISSNIAANIALTGQRVALVGLDIRNPMLYKYLPTKNIGVTNYLTSQEINIDGFMHKIEGYENFYVLPSGPIPPNPAELLLNYKVENMFKELRNKFDVVIVDNSPMHLVADTQLTAQYADAFIYVVRANYLDKDMLFLPYNLYNDKKLKNMSIVINDVSANDPYYRYKYYNYGYSQRDLPQKWYHQILNKIKKDA